jgi:hypothetical protein
MTIFEITTTEEHKKWRADNHLVVEIKPHTYYPSIDEDFDDPDWDIERHNREQKENSSDFEEVLAETRESLHDAEGQGRR